MLQATRANLVQISVEARLPICVWKQNLPMLKALQDVPAASLYDGGPAWEHARSFGPLLTAKTTHLCTCKDGGSSELPIHRRQRRRKEN